MVVLNGGRGTFEAGEGFVGEHLKSIKFKVSYCYQSHPVRYFSSKLFRFYLFPFSSTKGGRLLEMCCSVFLSRPRLSCSKFIFISITFASPVNLGRCIPSALLTLDIFSCNFRNDPFLLESRKVSERLETMTSDIFLALLHLLMGNKQELFLLSIVGNSISTFCILNGA